MVSETYMGGPADIANTSAKSLDLQKTWKTWASACQSKGTPTIVQLCHPGRQSPPGAGKRSFFSKTLAPSAVPMNFGPSLIERLASAFLFGTPRAMTGDEVLEVVDQFVRAARQCEEAGFKGIELHGAHGYLLAQFLSPRTNLRTDEFGGSPAARAEVVLRIIKGIRAVTKPEFAIGIKMNSVDASTSDSVEDTMIQIGLIVEAGIDFIEISGGTYENPRMMAEPTPLLSEATLSSAPEVKPSSSSRESFFLTFSGEVRNRFPKVHLMVTGGFRTRVGMEGALQSNACDLIGIGRPAAVLPDLPKKILLNPAVKDEDASVELQRLKEPWLVRMIPVKQVGAGYQSTYYAGQIQRMGIGLVPIDTRVKVV